MSPHTTQSVFVWESRWRTSQQTAGPRALRRRLEISYFSASGGRVARSKTGLFELRVTYDLRWETTEDERAFATQFTQFAAEPGNRVDVLQMNWVEVQAPIDRCCLCELVEGAAPSCLNLPCCVLCSFLTLGWLYHVWYNSLVAVVELHLCKTLRSTDSPGVPFGDARGGDARATTRLDLCEEALNILDGRST